MAAISKEKVIWHGRLGFPAGGGCGGVLPRSGLRLLFTGAIGEVLGLFLAWFQVLLFCGNTGSLKVALV